MVKAVLRNPKIHQAVVAMIRGEVIAYPTEAVWGLGADPFNEVAVCRVLALKRRSVDKGLILIAGSICQLDFLLEGFAESDLRCLKDTWPGHTTWLIPHRNRVPRYITGKFDTVAVRVSDHPIVNALCSIFSGPIVSTSANPQGYNPARTGLKARQYFAKDGVFFTPGVVGKASQPSRIFDLTTKQRMR